MGRLALASFVVVLVSAPVAVGVVRGEAPEIVVTRESSALPSGCTPREVAALLVRFTDAVNRGDAKALRGLFPEQDAPRGIATYGTEFRWYSVTEAAFRHTALYTRSDVLAYFADRHRQNERLELLAVDAAPSWVLGGAGIAYALRRDADDLPPWLSRFASGKGEIDCAGQRIYVWSMGHSADGTVPIPCPRPSGWSPGSAILACARAGDTAAGRSGPNARAATADFRVHATRARLARRCAPATVARTLRAALADFNSGRHASFSRRFAPGGSFHPYTATPVQPQLAGRQAIARFARARFEAGDGWTATALHPPARVARSRQSGGLNIPVGIYRLDILVTAPGRPLAPASSKVVVDCRSGLVRGWVGPGIAVPG